MDITQKFIDLTSLTYPYGHEDELRPFLPSAVKKDAHGNYYYKNSESSTVFACHLDTVSQVQRPVNHVIEHNVDDNETTIRTDGSTILGADDKAGMVVLLYLIQHNVPGLYYFFIGEEVGRIGSTAAAQDEHFRDYDRIISFDRRGTNSVITHQINKRCCSDAFALKLSKEYNAQGLNLSPDNTGSYTDSASFMEVIPECTNISVGYYNAHTHNETQDISYLIKLCNASTRINWESLPTKRDLV